MVELQKRLHEFDAQVQREIEGLACATFNGPEMASLGARITELWILYFNSTFERCERKVRGSSTIRLALPRRAATDMISHSVMRSGGLLSASFGLAPRAKTFDCAGTTTSNLDVTNRAAGSDSSNPPRRLVSQTHSGHIGRSPTSTLSSSFTMSVFSLFCKRFIANTSRLDGDLHEEPITGQTPDGVDNPPEEREGEDSDVSDTSSRSNGDEPEQELGDSDDEEIDEMISRVSGTILSRLSPSPSSSLIQDVQQAVEDFVVELLNDLGVLPLWTSCGTGGESSSSSVPVSSGSLSGSSKGGAPSHTPGYPIEDPEGNEGEQGDHPPGPDNAAETVTSSSPLCCPFRIRNPARFNSRDSPGCANKQWATLTLLKYVNPPHITSCKGH